MLLPQCPPRRSCSAPLLAALLGLAVGSGCSSSSVAQSAVTHPTMVKLDPSTFLGGVPCSDEAGGMRRYVATLFDITEAADGGAGGADSGPGPAEGSAGNPGFPLPSSLPTPCLAAVGFGFVVDGRRYRAEVDGYDRDDIEPRGAGTRQMVDVASRAVVPPHWRPSLCSDVVASLDHIVPIGGCTPLTPLATDPEVTQLRVSTAALLGALTCGTAEGQVETLRVSLSVSGEDSPRSQDVECGEDALFAGLPGGRSLSVYVTAIGAQSSTVFAGAKCQALSIAGATVVASCANLSELGTLRIDFASALAALDLGLGCDSSISELRVSVPGQATDQSFPPPDCLQPFDYGFKAGPASVSVRALLNGEELGSPLTCSAEVDPGSLVIAKCSANGPN
jgi:hypothetical protein